MRHLLLSLCLALGLHAPEAEAAKSKNVAFHAVKKKYAAHAGRYGITFKHMSKDARYGKGAYFALSSRRAKAEKGKTSVMMKTKLNPSVRKNAVQTQSLSKARLKEMSGLKSLRGTMKKGVIGPKLGQRLGKWADSNKRALGYQPAKRIGGAPTKGAWGHYYVPPSLHRGHKAATKIKPASE